MNGFGNNYSSMNFKINFISVACGNRKGSFIGFLKILLYLLEFNYHSNSV